ncbi:hypothetical protein GCM10027187_40350 [Streptosporangium sandarakinum]|uniref:Uncharacterized protein n=1 Tax=Streptosporangium sandarakinum TaxID=1260955 RepID=A0A852VC53_9ACTN|nr:hypothetical protein [Streptosporangium sandarakinum]NYF44634.1 hypothetical protein [Streptosporangium sandarakinum]
MDRTAPFLTHFTPAALATLSRIAIELYGTYGDPHQALTAEQVRTLNDTAQLLADLDEPTPAASGHA